MFQAPKLTNVGKALYYANIGGQGISFTTIKLGKGTLSTAIANLTDLVDTVVTIEAALSNGNGSYVDISGSFSNAGMTEGFYWREIGVFVADPNYPDDRSHDVLYCYQNAYDTADFIPAASVETVEKHITVPLIVGDAETVSCLLDPSLVYATHQDIQDHDQSETAHSFIRGLIEAVSDALGLHEQDSDIHVTAAQKQTWNGKATGTDISNAISTHNQSAAAHSDIRTAIGTAVSNHNTAADAHNARFAAKADKTALEQHTGSQVVHITSAERTSWNNAVQKATGSLALTLGRDANGIYVEF